VSYNVLIVDDSQTMRAVIQKSIMLSGFDLGECWHAANAREALKMLESHWVDLILTDLNMPGMNGLEMAQEIRKNAKYITTPILLISTQSSEKVTQEGTVLGIRGFIQKPFHPETIGNLLRQTMENQNAG
jgi:two-component system chemotaxis response regulator CheY